MTQGEFLERIGKTLYGNRLGWMSQLAAGLNISNGYLNNLHKNARPMTPAIMVAIKKLLDREAIALVDQIDMVRGLIKDVHAMDIAELTLGSDPEIEPDDNGPSPQMGG